MIMVRAKVMNNWDPILAVERQENAFVGLASAEVPLAK
jgi:hypothetical protein